MKIAGARRPSTETTPRRRWTMKATRRYVAKGDRYARYPTDDTLRNAEDVTLEVYAETLDEAVSAVRQALGDRSLELTLHSKYGRPTETRPEYRVEAVKMIEEG